MVASTEAVADQLAGNGALCTAAELTYAPRMGHIPEDSALMLRYQDGDTAAFETLYRRHNDALYRYLMRMCRHRATAEDVFQEVWGKIIKARSSYRPTAKFTTFLYRVAHNCFIDHVRRNKRHSGAAELEPELHADPQESPETTTERSLARERLHIALLDLPEEQRDAFLLHEEAGLSVEQIAHVTGSNRETAKSRLRYAVKKLRTAIEEPE
ncbi:MAG: RNA polymerase sigma factor [Gammaproteobacteria bacterium]|nr:RNA polymerase sigma factor [Gammaproteobacteria bacterium]